MKKTIVTFGLLSGAVSCVMMAITMGFSNRIGMERGYLVGYATIVLSFLLVYFGIRSYRDNVGGGEISFGKAFTVGLAITLISCCCYVVSWEIIYFNFMPDFMDKYSASVLAKARASGATPAALQAKAEELRKSAEMYKNPLINAAMTFLEPFPVGLVITLLSSGVLRRRPRAAGMALPASS